MSLSAIFKGWIGESLSAFSLWLFLDADTYIQINNATIPTQNGTTQIDHIIVSKYGIFVVETKNMAGWIFGKENAPTWTQSLYGKKYKFQNPLRQNYKHTKSLSDFLGIEHEKFFSIVDFTGDCEFKTPMPTNVINHGLIPYIKDRQDILFSDDDTKEIANAIKDGKLPRTWTTRRNHVESLEQRFNNRETCPKCGRKLTLRTAKSGNHQGSKFYGCTNFPNCRYTRQSEPA